MSEQAPTIKSDDENNSTLRRVARIWSGVIIGVGVLIFIGEILESRSPNVASYPFYENLIPFALFTSILGLALAWKWPGIGGAITVTSILISNTVYWITGREARLVVLLIHLPVLIPAILFLLSWWREAPRGTMRPVQPD